MTPAERRLAASRERRREAVLGVVRARSRRYLPTTGRDVRDVLHISPSSAGYLLWSLHERGLIQCVGDGPAFMVVPE